MCSSESLGGNRLRPVQTPNAEFVEEAKRRKHPGNVVSARSINSVKRVLPCLAMPMALAEDGCTVAKCCREGLPLNCRCFGENGKRGRGRVVKSASRAE